MAKIANNLTELIGGTPLMKLAGYSRKYGLQREVVAKLESFNPAGSVKDRVGLAMIEDAEARGALKPGATIIEPTSGNTGVGLAMVATIKGYHLILTMPETMSIERRNLLKALGAEIVLTDGLAGMAGSIAKAQELRNKIPGAVILQQFENPSNARIHELTTGEEIWTDTDGQVDVFVAGVGTGGIQGEYGSLAARYMRLEVGRDVEYTGNLAFFHPLAGFEDIGRLGIDRSLRGGIQPSYVLPAECGVGEVYYGNRCFAYQIGSIHIVVE